jgi:hypothetical protein
MDCGMDEMGLPSAWSSGEWKGELKNELINLAEGSKTDVLSKIVKNYSFLQYLIM